MKEVLGSKSVVGRLRCFFGVCTSINMRERFMSVHSAEGSCFKVLAGQTGYKYTSIFLLMMIVPEKRRY